MEGVTVLGKPLLPFIDSAPTAVTAFIDYFIAGPVNKPTPVDGFLAFQQIFGGLDSRSEASYQIQQFFSLGGSHAVVLRIAPEPATPLFASALKSSLTALNLPFNLLCIPATANLAPAEMHDVMLAAQSLCANKRAFYIADIPPSTIVLNPSAMEAWFANSGLAVLDCAAIYYPRLTIGDPLQQNASREIGYSGAIAGLYASTDSSRGVWKAPAGGGVTIPEATPVFSINDAANVALNSAGINAIRTFPGQGTVVWGARTTAGASNSDFKYINVRLLTNFIESSLYAGLQWVTFQTNGPTLWASISRVVASFLFNLWREGGFLGSKPEQAYFVKCDATTMTESDIDNGRVNIQIGFAPVRPAEFIILNIALFAGSNPPH
jgi:phage tail sheath protein FI